MGASIDPTVAAQSAAPDPSQVSSTAATTSPTDLTQPSGVSTMGQLANIPGGPNVINAIMEGVELSILDDLKHQEADLEARIKQDRQDAQDNS